MTLTQDRHLQTGIAGSFVIHALLLVLFAWMVNTGAARRLLEQSLAPENKKPEPEVVMIFPEQIVMVPPKPRQLYIRTTQNEETGQAPKNAAFQSDRNTRAASEEPPAAGATLPMPTLKGDAPNMSELANRDHRDGEIKNDSAPSTPLTPQMLPPPSPATPQPAQQAPPSPPVVKAVPISEPLARMMREMEKEAVLTDPDRLPIEVRKAAAPAVQESPPATPAQPETQAPAPQVREPQEAPPPVVRAVPVPDPILNTPKPEKDAFSPFTRTSKTDGAIQTPGQNAVDAEATPLGRYMRQVTGAVERKWHLYVRLGKDSVNFGRVRFRFYVDPKGVPQDLRILSDARDADPRMRELTLRAILDAQIPPIPSDLLPTLEDGRVKIEYEAIVY